MQDLLALFEQAFHIIYGHGLLQVNYIYIIESSCHSFFFCILIDSICFRYIKHASNYSGCCVEIYLELYMIILAKLMTETDEDVVQIYAQSAFFASYIGHALQHLCKSSLRLVVIGIALIIVEHNFPFQA